MLQFFGPPADAAHWIDGGVVARLGADVPVSRFPALPHAMLTMRVARAPARPATAGTLCGPVSFHTLSTEPAVHRHAGDITALGLLVRPAAAACLLGHAGGAVVNQVLDWGLVAGTAEAARLEDEVDGACSDLERLRLLLASLRRVMVAASRGCDAAYARLCDAVGRHGAQAADPLGLGRRQLERRCQAVLGVAPKQFQRLVRFHHALSVGVAEGAARMAQTALEAGFYDQSHLARDARQLAGAPMGRLLSAARPDSAWWSLATRRVMPGARELPVGGCAA